MPWRENKPDNSNNEDKRENKIIKDFKHIKGDDVFPEFKNININIKNYNNFSNDGMSKNPLIKRLYSINKNYLNRKGFFPEVKVDQITFENLIKITNLIKNQKAIAFESIVNFRIIRNEYYVQMENISNLFPQMDINTGNLQKTDLLQIFMAFYTMYKNNISHKSFYLTRHDLKNKTKINYVLDNKLKMSLEVNSLYIVHFHNNKILNNVEDENSYCKEFLTIFDLDNNFYIEDIYYKIGGRLTFVCILTILFNHYLFTDENFQGLKNPFIDKKKLDDFKYYPSGKIYEIETSLRNPCLFLSLTDFDKNDHAYLLSLLDQNVYYKPKHELYENNAINILFNKKDICEIYL